MSRSTGRTPTASCRIPTLLPNLAAEGRTVLVSQFLEWGSVTTIGLLIASVDLFGLLFVVERRVDNPLVNKRTLSNPPIAIINVASIIIGFALLASFVGTANYVQSPTFTGYGFGSSVLVAGLCLLPSGILTLLLSPVAARLISAWSPARVLTLAGSIIAAGLIMRIFATGALREIIVGSSIVGTGTGNRLCHVTVVDQCAQPEKRTRRRQRHQRTSAIPGQHLGQRRRREPAPRHHDVSRRS